MDDENVSRATRDGILWVTINRPKKLNALNVATVRELDSVMLDAESDDEVQGIVVTGAGEKAFVAGADISELNPLTAGQGTHFAKPIGFLDFAAYEAIAQAGYEAALEPLRKWQEKRLSL